MKKTVTILLIAFTVGAISSCGKGAKDKKGSLGDLKVELEKKEKRKEYY